MTTPATAERRALARLPLPLLVLATVVVLLLSLASACGADGGGDGRARAAGATAAGETSAPSPTPAAAPEAPPRVVTKARVVQVVGRLPKARRQTVRRDVTRVVNRWWRAAYLEGSYPRQRFRSFPGFSPGAKARARRDRRLLSNADIGASIVSVTPERQRVLVDVLAVDGRPRSATARFVLVFRTEGDKTARVQVRGRVFLSRRSGRWQIFGYDVAKGRKA